MRSSLSSGIITEAMLESREAFEAGCRAAVNPDPTLEWATVLGGYRIRTIPDDKSITPHLHRDGFWESWVSLALARYIKPQMVCVDVGANVGYFTLLMADRVQSDGRWGRTLAVEPQPLCITALNETIWRNELKGQVYSMQAAVAETEGQAYLLQYDRLWGSASFTKAKGYEPSARLLVYHHSLDRLLMNWNPIDIIKIDAEGAEALIWSGMRRILMDNQHLLVTVEVSTERDYDLGLFLHRIESWGFPLKVIEEDGTPREWSLDKIVEHGAELPTLWLER